MVCPVQWLRIVQKWQISGISRSSLIGRTVPRLAIRCSRCERSHCDCRMCDCDLGLIRAQVRPLAQSHLCVQPQDIEDSLETSRTTGRSPRTAPARSGVDVPSWFAIGHNRDVDVPSWFARDRRCAVVVHDRPRSRRRCAVVVHDRARPPSAGTPALAPRAGAPTATAGLVVPEPCSQPKPSCLRFRSELPNQDWQSGCTRGRPNRPDGAPAPAPRSWAS